MKIIFTIIVITSFIFKNNAQVVAYDFDLVSIGQIQFCFDLSLAKANIIGHQLNVNLTFHETLEDANTNSNPLKQLYTFSGGTERTIYPRVTSNSTGNFAVSELQLTKLPPTAPPGLCGYSICDFDSDGFELIDLNNFWCYAFTSYSNLDDFCDSLDSELWTKYFLTQDDALNEINEISNFIALNSSVSVYRKTKNINTGQYIIMDSFFEFINCDDSTDDFDSDGIRDILEDPNHNYDYLDDDTDKDGIPNYQDTDDDGDGILTIDEDYNQNGNPTDDDIDGSGVADYLELLVTLSNNSAPLNSISLYPNPGLNFVIIQFKTPSDVNIKIRDVSGKLMYVNQSKAHSPIHRIDLSNFNSGMYFVTIESNEGYYAKKIIIK